MRRQSAGHETHLWSVARTRRKDILDYVFAPLLCRYIDCKLLFLPDNMYINCHILVIRSVHCAAGKKQEGSEQRSLLLRWTKNSARD